MERVVVRVQILVHVNFTQHWEFLKVICVVKYLIFFRGVIIEALIDVPGYENGHWDDHLTLTIKIENLLHHTTCI